MVLSKEEKAKRSEERRLIKYNKFHKEVDGTIYKWCNHHKEYFPEEDDWLPMTKEYFYLNKTNLLDGFNTYCKRCSMKKATEWANGNREKYLAGIRRNNAKPEIKEQIREASRKQRKEGYLKEWQENNRDKTREYSKKREQKNHRISKNEWELCLKYFNNQCAYCGMNLDEHKKKFNQQLHKEHVDHEGSDNLSNCIPSCQHCNSQKWEFDMEEWYKQQEFFSEDRLNKINKWLQEDYKLYIEPPKPKGKYVKKKTEYWEKNI